jgi:2-succinyl-5-enolpyruvyl-6-hydroxy-3-cyclohexene-1-carboxylate synthase
MKINKNYLWADIFINSLLDAGIKHIVISPGSRNTSLTLAAVDNQEVKAISIIDERGAGFFALGLARFINQPVVLMCTSGTATAEYYPAIIEAFQQRVPLIVCTADRPEYLVDTGANQTIRQANIYKNHIRFFTDFGLPSPTMKDIQAYRKKIAAGLSTAIFKDKGPVHFNFPFEKPFEPHSSTNDISLDVFAKITERKPQIPEIGNFNEGHIPAAALRKIERVLSSSKNPLFLVGPGDFDEDFYPSVNELARRYNAVIFGDAASGIRFTKHALSNVVTNYDTFLRTQNIPAEFSPDVIMIFGRTMTSVPVEKLLSESKDFRIVINTYGDRFDPTDKNRLIINRKSKSFLLDMLALPAQMRSAKNNNLLSYMRKKDASIEARKKKSFSRKGKIQEAELVNFVIAALPDNSTLMLGNSLPIRDYDNFASPVKKKISVKQNRGASGIDGITATAFGLAFENKEHTFLVTGDVSFYYDINSLLIGKKYGIPLTILVINNNGGRIFDMLPVAQYGDAYKEYFITPPEIDFKPLVQGFKGNFYSVKTKEALGVSLRKCLKSKTFNVVEIVVDPEYSAKKRSELRKFISES